MSTDVDTILNDTEFVEWWESQGVPTHNLDFMAVGAIKVAYKAYLYGLSKGQTQ